MGNGMEIGDALVASMIAGSRQNPRLTRVIHNGFNVAYAPMSQLAPDVAIASLEDGTKDPKALMFIDPDGECHVYALDEGTRTALIESLTGGVVVP